MPLNNMTSFSLITGSSDKSITSINYFAFPLLDILVKNLEDDDTKVRLEAAEAIVKSDFYWSQDCNLGKCTVTSAAVKMASDLLLPIIGQMNFDEDQKSTTRCFR